MTYSCSDFTDDVLNKLVATGLIKQADVDGDDPQAQGTVALGAINTLLARVAALTTLVSQASVPGGIGEHEFSRPGGWRERALSLVSPEAGEPHETGALALFTVTLDWNSNNPEEGDYCTSVWAMDEDAAIRAVAEEMADHSDAGIPEGDDAARAEFVENVVQSAGQYAAMRVAAGLLGTIEEFMQGPTRRMAGRTQVEYETVKAILVNYGAS